MKANNNQKLRETVENIKEEAETTREYMGYPIAGAPGERGTCPVVDAEWLIDECKSALDDPPRNCDIHNGTGEAMRRYGFPTKSKPWTEADWVKFVDWLFAEAKGEAE